jgi:hypothetical protein
LLQSGTLEDGLSTLSKIQEANIDDKIAKTLEANIELNDRIASSQSINEALSNDILLQSSSLEDG